VVHGALLVEPTETESRETLDRFIDVMRSLAERAQLGDAGFFQESPRHTPTRRLDETQAARKPVLKWTPP
jgi:glycine dehydrogenase subunit 2